MQFPNAALRFKGLTAIFLPVDSQKKQAFLDNLTQLKAEYHASVQINDWFSSQPVCIDQSPLNAMVCVVNTTPKKDEEWVVEGFDQRLRFLWPTFPLESESSEQQGFYFQWKWPISFVEKPERLSDFIEYVSQAYSTITTCLAQKLPLPFITNVLTPQQDAQFVKIEEGIRLKEALKKFCHTAMTFPREKGKDASTREWKITSPEGYVFWVHFQQNLDCDGYPFPGGKRSLLAILDEHKTPLMIGKYSQNKTEAVAVVADFNRETDKAYRRAAIDAHIRQGIQIGLQDGNPNDPKTPGGQSYHDRKAQERKRIEAGGPALDTVTEGCVYTVSHYKSY